MRTWGSWCSETCTIFPSHDYCHGYTDNAVDGLAFQKGTHLFTGSILATGKRKNASLEYNSK